MKVIKVLALTKYGRLGASSRMRFLQYLPSLQHANFEVTVQSLLSDEVLSIRYQRGTYGLLTLLRAYANRCFAMLQRHDFDVMWIEKEALQWFPLWLELWLMRGTPYILDFDDAVFHHYDQHSNACIRYFYGKRLDGLMAEAAIVVGGNKYLAQRANDASAHSVVVLPTVIDLDRYPNHIKPLSNVSSSYYLPRIVWIGSPSTTRYLNLLLKPLQKLAKIHPFVLRVIGSSPLDFPGVQVEVLPWTEDTEVKNISQCDIGVMPLLDSLWERGKCGYKLIQYMACSLPVVASSVGVNSEIVLHGKNGFLVNTPDEWVAALGLLLEDQSLRSQMGLSGRRQVERSYCIQKTKIKIAQLLRAAAEIN